MKAQQLEISIFQLQNVPILQEKVSIYVNQPEGKLHIEGLRDMRAILHIIEVLTELRVVAEMPPPRLTVAAVPVATDLEDAAPQKTPSEQPELFNKPQAPKPPANAKPRTKPAPTPAPVEPSPAPQPATPTFPERLAAQVTAEREEEQPTPSGPIADLEEFPGFTEGGDPLVTVVPPPVTGVAHIEKVLSEPLPPVEVECTEFQGIKYPKTYFENKHTLKDRVIILYNFGYKEPEIKKALENTQEHFKVCLPSFVDNTITNAINRVKAQREEASSGRS